MSNKCLYCYEKLETESLHKFHSSCSNSFFGTKQPPLLPFQLNEMKVLAKNIVDRSIAVPGVQPKLSLSIIQDALQKNNKGRLTIVGALGGQYILKPPSEHYPQMPENEHLTMRIAEAFGISTVSSSLIHLQSGELAYITKRIDRGATGEKIHMLDMFQIVEAVDKYKSSLERIGKAIYLYSDNTLLDQLSFFELIVFCFLTGNNDMHLKNFSMIRIENQWKLAPAYDLLNVAIANTNDKEELALTLNGKKNKLWRKDFEQFGISLGLNKKQIDGVFNRFIENKSTALNWIKKSFLSENAKDDYQNLMLDRYAILSAN